MFEKEEEILTVRTKIRRWWKIKKDQMNSGFCYTWTPAWYNDIYYWVKDHLFPYNVIKIKSLGCRYTDQDNVLIHAAFQVLVNFVEKEWIGSKYHGHIFDLEKEAIRTWEEALTWSDKKRAKEYVAGNLEALFNQNERTQEIWHLYVWWKFIRPNREALNPLHTAELSRNHHFFKVIETDEDGDPTLYSWEKNTKDVEAEKRWNQACEDSRKFEEEEDNEDEQMFIRLAKIRKSLWT